MAQRFAMDESEHAAAVSCFSGYLQSAPGFGSSDPIGWLQGLSQGPAKPPYQPLPVMFTYTADEALGSMSRRVRDNFERWAARNQCTGASQEREIVPRVTKEVYDGCRGVVETLMVSLASSQSASALMSDRPHVYRSTNRDYHPTESAWCEIYPRCAPACHSRQVNECLPYVRVLSETGIYPR